MTDRVTATIHVLVAEMDAYADDLLRERFGFSFNHFSFLAPLSSGPRDITSLARLLLLTKAAVSKRVPVLEADGWVRTTAGLRRRVMVELTEKGAVFVEAAGALLDEEFTDLFVGLPEIDPKVLNSQLIDVLDALRAKPPLPRKELS